MPLVAGSDFLREGEANTGHVIVTRHLASTLWPGEPAIGKVLLAGPSDRLTELEVTGVVGDAYFGGRITDNPPRFIFTAIDARPGPPGETTFYVRHSGSTDLLHPRSRARCAKRTAAFQSPRCARSKAISLRSRRLSGYSQCC